MGERSVLRVLDWTAKQNIKSHRFNKQLGTKCTVLFLRAKGMIGNFVVDANNEAHVLVRGTAIAELHNQTLSDPKPRLVSQDAAITSACFHDGFFNVRKMA